MDRRWMAGWILAAFIAIMGALGFSSDGFAEGEPAGFSVALEEVKLFSRLTDGEREALESVAVLCQGKNGERIIRQGTPLDRMFVLLHGRVEVRVNGNFVASYPAQTLVGEMEFLDGLPASADVVLVEDSTLIAMPYAALTDLMERQPRLGYVLMREIAKIEAGRLRKSTQK